MKYTANFSSFSDSGLFSKRDTAYADQAEVFDSLLPYSPSFSGLTQSMKDLQEYSYDRKLLCKVLLSQYESFEHANEIKESISLLKESNTFTVITAHQPCLYLGPLYNIYKAISAIKLSRQLNEKNPDSKFLPVFIVGGEDHDFEEMNHFHLYNKELRWETSQVGSVGRMEMDGLAEVTEELLSLHSSEDDKQKLATLSQFYKDKKSFAEATRAMLHHLLGKYGLITVNMDNSDLKSMMSGDIKKEILEQPSISLVSEAQKAMNAIGFDGQTHIRDINFFYLCAAGRKRIEFEKDSYKVLDTDIAFSKEELLHEIQSSPDRFSPNVIMRPIYQQRVFPNVAYVGGGGELAYWMERKSQFEDFKVHYPVLVRRDSFLLLDKKFQRDHSKTDFDLEAYFQNENTLISQFVDDTKSSDLDITPFQEEMSYLFSRLSEKVVQADPTLSKSINAEAAKVSNSLQGIQKKLNRLFKQQTETSINRLKKLRSKILPSNKLQERYNNFLPYYLRFGDDWFEQLLEHSNPLDMRLKLLLED